MKVRVIALPEACLISDVVSTLSVSCQGQCVDGYSDKWRASAEELFMGRSNATVKGSELVEKMLQIRVYCCIKDYVFFLLFYDAQSMS